MKRNLKETWEFNNQKFKLTKKGREIAKVQNFFICTGLDCSSLNSQVIDYTKEFKTYYQAVTTIWGKAKQNGNIFDIKEIEDLLVNLEFTPKTKYFREYTKYLVKFGYAKKVKER